MLLHDLNYENIIVKSIKFPIFAGGASECQFSSYDEIAIGAYVEIRDDGELPRFQGYVTHITRQRNKQNQTRFDYTAICKSYHEYSQQFMSVVDYGDKDDSFSGTKVEYEKWLRRENANLHILWAPTGDEPIEYDDQTGLTTCPTNLISVDEVEENILPAFVVCEVKKYREKRFPCIANFRTDEIPTASQIKDNPDWANYGKIYKVMDPANPTQEYTAKLLKNATVGGSKLYVKGHPNAVKESLEVSDHTYSATLNPKNEKKTLIKKCENGNPDSTPVTTTKKNFVQIDMAFGKGTNGYKLPRVKGVHGTTVDKCEIYVRARYLEEIKIVSAAIGGANGIDRLPAVDHTEIVVSADKNLGNVWQDMTFAGCAGLLHETDDEGGGVWLSDLSGTYYEEDGIANATYLVAKAVSHYTSLRYSTNFLFAGINWNENKKILFETKEILLDSIEWTFGLRPEENRTRYSGVKLRDGFSWTLAEKKKWIKKQLGEREVRQKKQTPIRAEDNTVSHNVVTEAAKIAWKFNADSMDDESEAELMIKENGVWNTKQKYVWISQEESSMAFATAGNNTIFEIRKIQSNYNINGDIRDLYAVVRVVEDKGTKFTYFRMQDIIALENKIIGKCINGDFPTYWVDDIYAGNDASEAYIKTTINGVAYINQLLVSVPYEWDLDSQLGTNKYFERIGLTQGFITAVPVEPVLSNYDYLIWESALQDSLGTISTYVKRS